MNLLKDLLYTRGNVALDVARTCTAGSVVLYWGAVYAWMVLGHSFDPIKVGTGLGLIFTAGCAWIHFRQKQETGLPPVEGDQTP